MTALRQNTLVRIIERFGAGACRLALEGSGDRRGRARAARSWSWGAGSSISARIAFLGLDQDSRVQQAIQVGVRKWGTHNGSSRAFASVRANIVAEQRLAEWLGVESTLIYPSVMLANLGAIPGLTGRHDAIAMDEMAHSSMQEAAKIARANGHEGGDVRAQRPCRARADARGLAALSLRFGLHRRRVQHERQDPADGGSRCGGPGRFGRAVHRRCPRDRCSGRARAGDGARSPGQLRKRVRRGLAVEGVLMCGRVYRLPGVVSPAAQDSFQLVRFRRAGRSLLSGSHRDGDRHPLLERI